MLRMVALVGICSWSDQVMRVTRKVKYSTVSPSFASVSLTTTSTSNRSSANGCWTQISGRAEGIQHPASWCKVSAGLSEEGGHCPVAFVGHGRLQQIPWSEPPKR